MALPWVRLDTQFGTNPKILNLIEQKAHPAIVVYICSLGYAGAHGTAGYIPTAALPFLHGTKRHAQQLVTTGLWHETIGGWQINDWDTYQLSGEEAEKRREKAQLSALARWHPDKYKELRNAEKPAM